MVRYEKIHSKLSIDMSLMDKIKFILGWKVQLSYCMKVLVSEVDGKFEYMKVDSVEPNIAVWRTEEPAQIDANLRVAKIHDPE